MRLIDADALMELLKAWQYEAQRLGAEINNRFATAIIAQVNAMPTIEPDPKWIPCSERLPKEDGEYLVLYYTQSKYKPYVYDVMSFANDLYKIDDYDFFDKKGQKGWFYCDREYGFCEASDVYAWMPLPEPYKEES